MTDSNKTQNEGLKALSELASKKFTSLEDICQTYVLKGRMIFGLETGMVSHTREESYTVLWSESNIKNLSKGSKFKLVDTYCNEILRTENVVSFDHVGILPEMKGHPFHINTKLESYIGAPIYVGGSLYGTLSFSSQKVRYLPFEEFDHEIILLMAKALGNAIEYYFALDNLSKQTKVTDAIIDNIYDCLILSDEDRRIIKVNSSFEMIFGYSEQEVLNQKMSVIYENDAPPGERELEKKESLPYEVTYKKKAGAIFPGETIDNQVTDENGNFLFFLYVIRDITRRKESEKLKEEFIGTMNHEVRTPLTSIIGSLRLLQKLNSNQLDENSKELLDISVRNSDHLLELINDILNFQKLSSDSVDLHFKITDISKIVGNAISNIKGFCLNHGSEIIFDGEVSKAKVFVDDRNIHQVLSNLFSNALKFSPKDSKIRVQIKEGSKDVRVEVSDAGLGIPDEMESRIFKNFSQIDSTDARRQGGTGLGLAICKKIIDLHSGNIGFKNNLDRGTTFYFTLPRVQ